MTSNISLTFSPNNIKSTVLDILALSFIYFIPALSHLLNVPLYLIEPMRIMLVLAIVHTNKKNAYLIALTLPLFSFLVSSHPNLFKGIIITAELLLNVWLFYEISKRTNNKFFAMLGSILLSKIFYYMLKFGLISFAVLQTGLISTPLYLQLITSFVFSGYLFFIFRRRQLKDSK